MSRWDSGSSSVVQPPASQLAVRKPLPRAPAPIEAAPLAPSVPVPEVPVEVAAVASPSPGPEAAGNSVQEENEEMVSEPPAEPAEKPETLVVKLLTDDPNVVIYWLVDQNGGQE